MQLCLHAFYDGTIGQLMGGFSSGLILFILISSLGKYTRGHVNPAVTLIEFRLGYIGKKNCIFLYTLSNNWQHLSWVLSKIYNR